jgi:REP element-mobilizing transposase RayT
MECCFGEVKNGQMFLNNAGETVRESLLEIPRHFPFVDLTEYAVMPNHFHAVLTIDNNFVADTEKRFELFPTETVTDGMLGDSRCGDGVNGGDGARQGSAIVSTNADDIAAVRFRDQGKRTVSSITGSCKSYCSKIIRKNFDKNFHWQKGFWDHLIKDHDAFVKITNYIRNNPAKWDRDRNNEPGLWY